jgi:aminoglycoside phosphotransferase (APT) family kinase protein
VLWAKQEVASSPVAGVRRETALLATLHPHFELVPDVVVCSKADEGADTSLDDLVAPWLVTYNRPGRRLDDVLRVADSMERRKILRSVAGKLAEFQALSNLLPEQQRWRGADLFGDAPHLLTLLAEGAAQLRAQASSHESAGSDPDVDRRLVEMAAKRCDGWRPEEPALTHGSFDSWNVLSYGSTASAFLDLEATRFGPPSFDLASMTMSLAIDVDVAAARAWAGEVSGDATSAVGPNVAAQLVLRAINRRVAGELDAKAFAAVDEILSVC